MKSNHSLPYLLAALLLAGMPITAGATPEEYFAVQSNDRSICASRGHISPSHTGTKIDGYRLVFVGGGDHNKPLELREDDEGRGGYNSLPVEVESGRGGYNKPRNVARGRSGYNSVPADVEDENRRSSYNKPRQPGEGQGGDNNEQADAEIYSGRSGYNKRHDLEDGRDGRSGYSKRRGTDWSGVSFNSVVFTFGDGTGESQYHVVCSEGESSSFMDGRGNIESVLIDGRHMLELYEIHGGDGEKLEGAYMGWKGVVRWGFMPVEVVEDVEGDGETYWTGRLMTPEAKERDGEVFGFLAVN